MNMARFALILTTIILLAGCQSDRYYQDRAVQSARRYLLKNAPELTVEQREYVQFNRPRLLYGEYGDLAVSEFLTADTTQICVTWIIPGQEKPYLVMGLSGSSMREWSPIRLIRMDYPQNLTVTNAAVKNGREYVFQSLYNLLPVSAATEVRFGNPEVYLSAFNAELGIDVTDPEERAAILRELGQKTQMALVWRYPDDPGTLVIVFGYGNPDMSRWRAQSGGLYKAGETSELLLEKVQLAGLE